MQSLPIYNAQLMEAIPTANFTPLLTPEQCVTVINLKSASVEAKVGTGDIVTDIRKTIIHPIPQTDKSQWLYELIADRVGRVNMTEFNFNVAGIFTDLQLLEYGVGGHYDWHIDTGPGESAFRKLSIIIQLSDPEDYEGGEVLFKAGNKEHELPKDQGQIAVFPSYILHKVNPITKGTRYALVAWAQGHERFK